MYEAIHNLLQSGEFSIVESFELGSTPALHAAVPSFLEQTELGGYLAEQHTNGLWRHQAQALEALGRGENVVISTGTASGKSLVFQAIALHKVLLDPDSRVAVFYPLRALVADQLRGWREIARTLGIGENAVGQIDGSVPVRDRNEILRQSKVVVMTPDVCHAWLMSNLSMPDVRQFVRNLSTLIMDEAHTLEGVFGSNFAFLIRRLVAARAHLMASGTENRPLQIVAATATIANPGEHMEYLTGVEFSVVDHDSDGSPRHERIVAHIACPEGSELEIAKELQSRVLRHGQEGGFITFVDSRKGVETLAMASQEDVDQLADDPAVVPYRAGYTPDDRRRIEQQLRSGGRRGVVSTSALELGIDLPHLRVGFNVGVPATRKAYRQRLGRVGRSGRGAFVVIGPPNAFTRYGTSLAEYHAMSVEPSHLYLDNRFMQFAHGRCLAKEMESLAAPNGLPDPSKWPNGFDDVYLAAQDGGYRPVEFQAIAELGGEPPQYGYPLRNVGEFNYQIKRNRNADGFGEVSQSQALRECYPGGTYLHNAQAFEVTSWFTRGFEPSILVRPTSPHRFTRPRITTWVNAGITASDVVDGHFAKGETGFLAECQMQITERVDGYFDGQGYYQSYQDLQQHNPAMRARSRRFNTSGVVLCIDEEWFRRERLRHVLSEKLREVFAHEYSLMQQDVGSAFGHIAVRGSEEVSPRNACIAVFDSTYGSLRFTEKLYLEFERILDRLAIAARAEVETDDEMIEGIARIRERIAAFAHGAIPNGLLGNQVSGYDQVFTEGSRVLFREHGQIAQDVEVIEPTVQVPGMEGLLMYRVRIDVGPGQPPSRRWVPADRVEPSADADAWEYAWWNRATETYENPPDEADDG